MHTRTKRELELLAILISNEIYFKTTTVSRDKERHDNKMVNPSAKHDNYKYICILQPKPKMHIAKLTEFKKRDNSKIIVGGFNTTAFKNGYNN